MKIDERVEALTRSAIDAAVKRNFGKLEAALQAFPDDDAARGSVELALAVTSFVLYEVYAGKPTPEQTRVVAVDLVEMEKWAEPTVDEVDGFLSRLLNGQAFAPTIPAQDVIVLAFIVTAHLLSSFRKGDEHWWDFLDLAETAIEAAPER
ncbi:hypothetical protein [Actinoplanes derwentensis]|uniref:Uncharacterized protein n=1 Tax=Actinoplanes derwentensis TaxID=113562 RepID=A0A1H2BRL5_9ACTN|nr:hypothetical protein [Actinoplanes derwentensis]GID83036.1 hypothetical protein Ade03nite_19600 [Actinoplanes derwentensis]SDT61000.1 hypothetical protein SAMN04489716_4842 [Actinoplanes derwentensis]